MGSNTSFLTYFHTFGDVLCCFQSAPKVRKFRTFKSVIATICPLTALNQQKNPNQSTEGAQKYGNYRTLHFQSTSLIISIYNNTHPDNP